MKYRAEAAELWRSHVPPRGQADTVQGELIRAVEKLRDEAHRNGNVNWGPDHARLVEFVRETLVSSELFDEQVEREIQEDADRMLDFEHPETSDEPYDRLTDRLVEWSREQPGPVPRSPNTDLRI